MSRVDIVLLSVGARGPLEPRWNTIANHLHVIAVDADADAPIHARVKRLEIIRHALADAERDATLYVTRKPDCSSLYLPNFGFLKRFSDVQRFDVVAERRIQARPLSALGYEPDFIKIDAQGAELMILQGVGPALRSVIGLEVEVEFARIYKDQPLFGEVDAFLRAHDFELCDLNRTYWRALDSRRHLIFADALYFKRPDFIPSPDIAAALASVYSRTLWRRIIHRSDSFEVDGKLEV